jgi:DNA-binding transcriptional LysR family regulator
MRTLICFPFRLVRSIKTNHICVHLNERDIRTMGQIEDLRLFVKVVDSGGIARAAEEMNIAKSAVSRRLAQLEERYSVRLIDRQPRVWEVTSAGQELYQRASQMVAEVDELDADFLQVGHTLKGPLSITIAREFGLAYLKPTLFKFAQDHPNIDLTIDFDDRTVDLDSENYDLALRVTATELQGLHCHRLGTTQHGLFASKGYAATRRLPENEDELSDHPLLHYGAERRATWAFGHEGKRRTVKFRPALRSNYGTFLLDAALNDDGIIRLPLFVVDKQVQKGKLVPVMPHLKHVDYGIYVVHSSKRRLNKRMRAMIDALSESCVPLKQ